MAQLPDLIGNEIVEMTEFFKRTKNPAAAWRAYSLAQGYGRPIPPEIQAEVNRFADCVSAAVGKVIQSEVDLFAATSTIKMDEEKTKARDRLVRFAGPELYKAWRGNGGSNPIGALQKEWRDSRIFAAISKLVEGGVRPGRAREIVKESGHAGVDLDSIEQIWKRLKTKRQPVHRSDG